MAWRAVLEFLFPPQCACCNAIGSGFCDACAPPAQRIVACFPTLRVRAFGLYEGPLRAAVLALKDGRRDVAEALGLRAAPLVERDSILLPIPTTVRRVRTRGLDGVAAVARYAAALAGARSVTALEQRSGDAQRGRSRVERLAARGRFTCRSEVAARRVTLFDDVCTTGSTLRDCATAVREAGGVVEDAVVLALTKKRLLVGNSDGALTPLDRLFLERTYELAARALGSTLPNPPVGAVVVRDGRIVGEGYHYRAGEAHAELQALQHAGDGARGATLYLSLEPCGHVGRTPPCTDAVIASGVARVVAGTPDPAGHGGANQLREHGIEVAIRDEPAARDLIEPFTRSVHATQPYVALKMAVSLDGFVTSRRGVRERLGSRAEEQYVRDLRTAYDAVMVGAGTVRVDDPLLTVRPPHDRARPYVRIVVCDRDAVAADSRVFEPLGGYARTIVLAPHSRLSRFESLRAKAEIVGIDSGSDGRLDLPAAMRALRRREIMSVLCEGGPQLGASLLAARVVDRVYWAIAPRFLGSPHAVPALFGADLIGVALQFDRAERIGSDVVISARVNV